MFLQKKTYKVHGLGVQHIIKVFGYPIVVSIGDYCHDVDAHQHQSDGWCGCC